MNDQLLAILSENSRYKEAYYGFLEIHKKNRGGTPIGFIIFCDMRAVKEQMQLKRIAIIDKGKGYGKEALLLAQRLAFEVFDTKNLYLGTKETNLRAQSIYKAIGFIPDMPDPCTRFHINNIKNVCDEGVQEVQISAQN
ncbi:MAG: GNAT family N-acetyltransferase [Lachnospiraceae bacterium]|nr:GNAT family N-acetyltransferase [Lachnospiraceae bacterium]